MQHVGKVLLASALSVTARYSWFSNCGLCNAACRHRSERTAAAPLPPLSGAPGSASRHAPSTSAAAPSGSTAAAPAASSATQVAQTCLQQCGITMEQLAGVGRPAWGTTNSSSSAAEARAADGCQLLFVSPELLELDSPDLESLMQRGLQVIVLQVTRICWLATCLDTASFQASQPHASVCCATGGRLPGRLWRDGHAVMMSCCWRCLWLFMQSAKHCCPVRLAAAWGDAGPCCHTAACRS
jgi:hypothetical protein